MDDRTALAAIKRRLDHFERDPSVLSSQDTPALSSLEVRLTKLRANSNIAQSSLPAELDQLIARTQRLSRNVAAAQAYGSDEDEGQDDDDYDVLHLSPSAIARQLQESIASQHLATITLPPTPKLVVNEDPHPSAPGDDPEKRRLALEQREDDISEYEQGAAVRRRQGYMRDEDGDRTEKAPTTSEKPSSSSAPSQPLLSTERTTQEALSNELLRMASVLRSQTVSFSDALERDRKLLESADEKLIQNMDVMTRTRGKLGEYAQQARGMGWFTLGTVLMVVVTWVIMFVVIKLT
ncbi:hypothetical protein BDZ90DRAFT_259143 [Jaminaea rosea]|uniref:t-SNARE coiled-coil homology domain-containing protein n=1 Tax=Jaminaea rosea TaxID=1569628 RepID=A0A316UUU9_9BASI|nr:hypothetical protein BDZ90DRAFT_259143 [Jaminaea rosea]PWN29086.1 hypothetical protein BDZ90DRAFT_259143 [Jaminaea rosea]